MTNDFKKILKISVLSFLLLFILIYGIFKARYILFGVSIKNLNIKDNDIIKEEVIKIKGNTKNAIYVTINDREIFIDKQGNFEEDYAMQKGYNLIKILAKDKFGNEDSKKINLIGEFEN